MALYTTSSELGSESGQPRGQPPHWRCFGLPMHSLVVVAIAGAVLAAAGYHRPMLRWLLVASVLAMGTACAPKPWVVAARAGSLSELQRYVEVAADRKQFNHSRTVDLAGEIAEREIETANDPGAYDRILTLGPCVSQVFWSLKHRSTRKDDEGAAASIVLFESGYPEGLRDVSPKTANGAWRAFGVRTATTPAERQLVTAALIDPDARVRRAAIDVMRQNPQPTDATALLDVVRHDPELALKQAALAALGEVGDTSALRTARDYWDEMPEPVRLTLVQAFNAPLVQARGGESLLVHILETNDSLEGVVAASLIFNDATASRGLATARLIRALREGSPSERLVALGTLPPSDSDVRFEIQKLAVSSLPYLRTAALEIYLRQNFSTELVMQRLNAIAASKDADAGEAARVRAKYGDKSAVPLIERQLTEGASGERLTAARLLLKLEDWDGVARALTDDHPSVRLKLACDVLQR